MDDQNIFEGDILLQSTLGGGDIVIENGLVKDCRNFDTAAYLSLFGGNKGDLNARAKETWWGNLIPGTKRNEWMQSEFAATVAGLSLTGGNLLKARQAAERDLDWIKKDAGADKIFAALKAENPARVRLEVEVKKSGAAVAGGAYELQWQGALK